MIHEMRLHEEDGGVAGGQISSSATYGMREMPRDKKAAFVSNHSLEIRPRWW